MSEFEELCDKHGFSIKVSEGGVWRFYPTLADLLDRVESQLGWDTYTFTMRDPNGWYPPILQSNLCKPASIRPKACFIGVCMDKSTLMFNLRLGIWACEEHREGWGEPVVSHDCNTCKYGPDWECDIIMCVYNHGHEPYDGWVSKDE